MGMVLPWASASRRLVRQTPDYEFAASGAVETAEFPLLIQDWGGVDSVATSLVRPALRWPKKSELHMYRGLQSARRTINRRLIGTTEVVP